MKRHATPSNGPTAESLPWFYGEDEIDLAQVVDRFPRRSSGKKVHRSTIWRWAQDGVAGIKLRTFRLGPRRLGTTVQEVSRFLARITAIHEGRRDEDPALARTLAERDLI